MPPRWFPQGGGAAVAAPSFVVGAASTPTNLTLAGIKTSDLVVAISCGNTQFPTTPIGWSTEVSGALFVAGAWINVYTRTIRPQDTTTLSLTANSAGAIAMAAFRTVFAIDGLATLKTGTSTAPISNSFTNTINNGIAVNCVGFDAAAGTGTYTVSTGYTLAATFHAVSGVNFGVAIEYKLLASAGTVAATSGAALSTSGDWGVYALALHP